MSRSIEDLSAKSTVSRLKFNALERTFSDILCAAEALQNLSVMIDDEESINVSPALLVESLGRHIQNLRNTAAKELEPIYECFGVEPIGY